MWSIVSSMKLLRKPSKRGEGDIEKNKGSTASLKDHSKEGGLRLDSDVHVNLDPSCSTDTGLNGIPGKGGTLGSGGASGSGNSSTLPSGTKVKVERRESARLASSATKFLRSLRSHSGGGKLATSSVIAADDKHPINVIALKELDIETHSLNPGAANPAGSSGSRGGASGKLPERSQSFNEKRLLVPTQNTSADSNVASRNTGSSGQVKVKHSRAQSFVCNNSSSRNKSGYSIYMNHHQQFQSSQQNQANLVKQQLLFDQRQQNSTLGSSSGRNSQQQQQCPSQSNQKSGNALSGSKGEGTDKPSSESSNLTTALRAHNLQSCDTIYENLEVILEEKQNQEHMISKSNITCGKDYGILPPGSHSQSAGPAHAKSTSGSKKQPRHHETGIGDEASTKEGRSGSAASLKADSPTTSTTSDAVDANMRISGKERPIQGTRKYTKDSGYETSCSDYSNIILPKSPSVDSIATRMTVEKGYQGAPAGLNSGAGRSNRILNTALYEEINVSPITEDAHTAKSLAPLVGATTNNGGRKLRRSISEVPSERNTNLAKLQTKVGDSTARAMYTIANGLAVWTTEKSSSSLGLNGGTNSGSTQGLNHYQNIYGCRPHSHLLQPQSVAPIPGGFSAAVQQASVYSTLPRNHVTSSHSSNDNLGVYRGFQYRRTPPQESQPQGSVSQYSHYQQIGAKSTPSLRNAVLQEQQIHKKSFADSTDDKQPSSSKLSTSQQQHVGSELSQQQQPIYQTIPVPTLSPARSTPNLGSTKLVTPRPIQQQHTQGSIPQLSIVSVSQQQVNDLGKSYPKTQNLHQKIYNHFGSSSCLSQQQSLSSSVVQLQQLQSNDKVFTEPAGRYPSTPNLQKSDSTNVLSAVNVDTFSELQCNLSSSHCGDPSSNTGSTNHNTKPIPGAMSASNESMTSTTSNSIGGNWNPIDAQSILNNNNNNQPPARDPSSLKQIRYGPGHEKYPSWPIPVSSAQQIDPAGESQPVKLVLGSGSTRSKSWTEQTDYPKEKTPSYARPYMKRVNHSYTQQLKTVMEKCERIPPEAFTSQADPQQLLHSHILSQSGGARHSPHHHQLSHGSTLPKPSDGGILPPPLLYRDLMCNQQNGHGNNNTHVGYNSHLHQNNLLHYYQSQLSGQQPQQQQHHGSNLGEKEYMIPSPPEKENTVSKPLTQEDLELYTKKYEELMTQYPQSEGYHSYISSDSSSYISSGTPFLDQLRRESENNQQFWAGDKITCDPNDPLFGLICGQLGTAAVSGRESVTTVVTNSSSNSSGNETLKWHGSTSDISLASGAGGNNMHSSSNLLSSSMKQAQNGHNNNPGGRRGSGSANSGILSKGWGDQQPGVVHSARLSTPQKQHAATPDSSQQSNGVTSVRNKLESLNGSPALSKWHSTSSEMMDHLSISKNNSNGNNNAGSNNIFPQNLKKFPLNTYTRPNALLLMDKSNAVPSSGASVSGNSSSSATSTPEKMAKLLQTFNPDSTPKGGRSSSSSSSSNSVTSPVIDTSKPPSVAERIMELEQQQQQHSSSPSNSGTSSPKMGHGQASNENLAFLTSNFIKSSSLNNLQNSPGGGMYIDESSGPPSQQNDWISSSQGNMASPRGFLHSLSSSTVNKVESGSLTSYSYLDPDKKHKVADMTLKAIQKKALLSYYERHKGKCANTSSASSVSSSDGNSQADGLPPEKDLCFSGKPNRLMLSLPKEHSIASLDHQTNSSALSENSRGGPATSSSSNASTNPSASSSPSLTGLSRGYRAISVSSGVSSSSSPSSRSRSSSSNSKVSSQSQQHHQLVHGANNNNLSPKTFQPTNPTAGLLEDTVKQMEKSESRQTLSNSSTPDGESTDIMHGTDSARLAYMSKYLPHLVNRDSTTPSTSVWPSSSGSGSKLPQGGPTANNGATTAVTQEPAPTPPERPPKKPHLRNLAQQAHEDGKESKPPPPLPRAPVRPPALLNNGGGKAGSMTSGPPPIPNKPVLSVSSGGGLGMTRSPSPDELPPPPPPPSEDVEVLTNDDPLPPPPTVTEVDVLFGSRTRSVSGLSSCLHKDSYMAQRKERTLGYEGRYRRTLSPSGLGSNSGSKSSLESATPAGASDTVGTARAVSNLTSGGKLDSTLSPSAWEKFHNIRPPSTTVIFTSNELSRGAVSPTSSSTPSTSGSPQPPASQPLFQRSISCDSNIFNNKTGASQSSIPPPVAQVAPLRGSTTIHHSNELETGSLEKIRQAPLRNDVIPLCPSPGSTLNGSGQSSAVKSCDNDSCGQQLQSSGHELATNIVVNSDIDRDEKYFRDAICQTLENRRKELGEHSSEQGSPRNCAVGFPNTALPSMIVPPLQHEKYEKEPRGCRLSLNSQYSTEATTLLKKSEVSLRVNCADVPAHNKDVNGHAENGTESKGSSTASGDFVFATPSQPGSVEGCPTSKGSSLSSISTTSNSTASFYTGRQKTQEELECEELSRDIAKLLPHGDKLQTLLVPLPDHKTTADYMEGLFHLELKLQPETGDRRAAQIVNLDQQAATYEMSGAEDAATMSYTSSLEEVASQSIKTNPVSGYLEADRSSGRMKAATENGLSHANLEFSQINITTRARNEPEDPDRMLRADAVSSATVRTSQRMVISDEKAQQPTLPASYRRCNGHAPLPADSAYFTTSESKAKFLTQYNKDIKKDPIGGTGSEDLDKQKEELVARISRKLEILRTEQLALREEIQANEQLGQMVVERVKQTAKRNEFDKFKLHVEEIEKITSLLLGISGRLARAENALMGLSDPPNPQEKKILESKRDKLREQLDEAKILKENIDRRSAQVSSFLQKYLTAEEYADYDHFVKMKAKLIIDAREIDDKIKLGEEQLGALKDALSTTLPLSPSSSTS